MKLSDELWSGTNLYSAFENFIAVSIYRFLRENVCFSACFFFKSGYIILFTVPELIRLYTYLSHLSSEKCQGTNSLCGQILPQELYKIRKPAPLKNQRDRGMQATRISNQNSLLGRTPNSATWLTRKEWDGIKYLRQ